MSDAKSSTTNQIDTLLLEAIPDNWFLHDLGECVLPVYFAGDRHDPTGLWQCGLQYRDGGGRMTRANGRSPGEALLNAVEKVVSDAR